MARKKKQLGYVKVEDVLQTIQNDIRNIQMHDYGTDSGITQLYALMAKIEKMPSLSAEELATAYAMSHMWE